MHFSKNVRIGGGAHDSPMETVPRLVTIEGETHMLAYINREEAKLLRERGGGEGEGGRQLRGPGGVPAFAEGEGGVGGDGSDGRGDGGNDGGGNQDGSGGDRGFDPGRDYSPNTPDNMSGNMYGGSSINTGGPDLSGRGGGGGVGGGQFNPAYDYSPFTPSTVPDNPIGGPNVRTGGDYQPGFNDNYGGQGLGEGPNVGTYGGGGGGTESPGGYNAPAPPPPAAPKGPTQAEIDAENAKKRLKAQDDAEKLVRDAFAGHFNDAFYSGRQGAYTDANKGKITGAQGQALSDLVAGLAPSGLANTPLANRGAAGLGEAAKSETNRLTGQSSAEVTDYKARVAKALAAEIARVRAAIDPNAAYTQGTTRAINDTQDDIFNRPLADFVANLGYTPDQVSGLSVKPPRGLVEALRQRGLGAQLYEPAVSGRVVG